MSYLQPTLIGVLGLAIGSFLNVVIYRLPRWKQFVTGRSLCPDCGEKIKWYHNIPLVSYLALLGRCAYCGKRISLRYPLVELLNGLSYLYFFWQFGWSLDLAVFAFLSSALIVIFFVVLAFYRLLMRRLIPDTGQKTADD